MDIPRKEYPRPQFQRKSWVNLNGKWDFCMDDDNKGEQEKWYLNHDFGQQILVPFSFESKASGIGSAEYHPYIWYKRDFVIPESFKNKRIILNFQAVDYRAKVWINGIFVGQHDGGYSSFSFDITDKTNNKTNTLIVKVVDKKSCFQPRGKQTWKDDNFGCWYNRTSGIWQTVWLEFLNSEIYFKKIKMTPNIDDGSINIEYYFNDNEHWSGFSVKSEIKYKGKLVKEFTFLINSSYEKYIVSILDNFFIKPLWTPEDPRLFDVNFYIYKEDKLVDYVESYFGMRKISINNGQVLLNNKPIYQKLILDQGYWPESLLTPPSDEAIKKDIKLAKEMGFNGARKHQKVEDARFYYWCDKMGFLVWAEMGATYKYSDIAINNFTGEWLDVIQQLYNHPSIITWTPFNESWGIPDVRYNEAQQHFTKALYYLTKSVDTERPVIVNDGWEHTISDLITLHDYEEDRNRLKRKYNRLNEILKNIIPHHKYRFAFADGYKYNNQPIQISEFGGIAFKSEEGWGYGTQVKTEKDFLERFRETIEIITSLNNVSGYCYTQFTDIQQEINGLLTFDRKPKVDIEKIREIINS